MRDKLTKERDEEIAKCAAKQEVMAAGEYAAHLEKATSKKLRAILLHNQQDELNDHAARLEEFVLNEEAKEKKVKI